MLESYQSQLILAFVLRVLLCLGLVLLAAFSLGGCTTKQHATVTGGAAPSTITQTGPATGTWNRIPQGGDDEKSNSAPTKPAD
jgi:hypothetical protein